MPGGDCQSHTVACLHPPYQASVFKKFDESNLFQISCSGKLYPLHCLTALLKWPPYAIVHLCGSADAIERFQLALFLSLILLQDVSSWAELRMFAPTAVSACAPGPLPSLHF
jgi:hypothetical protein